MMMIYIYIYIYIYECVCVKINFFATFCRVNNDKSIEPKKFPSL